MFYSWDRRYRPSVCLGQDPKQVVPVISREYRKSKYAKKRLNRKARKQVVR